jgi:DNA polymerase I-like protein with 3'-5' exonuclease and polymerase domains
MQNITKNLREMFIPDDGYTLFYADLKSAESIAVAYLAEDQGYIKACEADDIHSFVAKMVWPELPWGTAPDREIADRPYYRQFSYRDLSKRGGHGSNYYGTPKTMGRNLKVQEKIMHRFQTLYYGGFLKLNDVVRWGMSDLIEGCNRKVGNILMFNGAFPGIRDWHDATRETLQTEGEITTPLARKRQFWDRLYSDTTLREAIAFVPQSVVADILNIGLFLVWRHLDNGRDFMLLGQVHDAIVGQVRTGLEEHYAPLIKEHMEFDVPINGRTMHIPIDIKWGTNWKEVS